MSNNNAPDEAERLLNSLIGADRDCVLAYKPSCRADAEALRQRSVSRLEAILSQLLPLVRAGMAVQRLEAAEPSRVKITDGLTGWNATIELQHGEGHGSWGPSIADAINAALDAAGVE